MGDGSGQEMRTPDFPTNQNKVLKKLFWGVGGSGSEIGLDFKKNLEIKLNPRYWGEKFFFRNLVKIKMYEI